MVGQSVEETMSTFVLHNSPLHKKNTSMIHIQISTVENEKGKQRGAFVICDILECNNLFT